MLGRIAASILICLAFAGQTIGATTAYMQTNFTAGELSPYLSGRVDWSKYYNGAAELTNFIVRPQGGISRRPGTYFVEEVKDSTKTVRLIPFEFSTEQAYILEFGDVYIRFYMNGAQIESGGGAYEISTPYAEADLPLLQFAQSADVMYIAHPDYAPRKLSRTGHTSWTLAEVEFIDGPYLDRGIDNFDISLNPNGFAVGATITITASDPYFDADMVGGIFRIGQSGATTTKQFTADSQTGSNLMLQGEFSIDLTPDTEDGWDGKLTLQKTQDAAVSWNDVGWVIGSEVKNFYDPHFGNYYRLNCKSGDYGEGKCRGKLFQDMAYGYVQVTGYTSTQSITAEVIQRLRSTLDRTTDWQEGAWSPYRGYPATVAFFNQRLCFANTHNQPDTIWCSRVNDFEHFSPGTEIDDALSFTLADQQVNAIHWMRSHRGYLVLGTGAGVWSIGATNTNDAFSAENVKARRDTDSGSASLNPVRTDSALIYAHRALRNVYDLDYYYESDSMKSADLMAYASHIIDDDIAEIAYTPTPFPMIWVLKDNGKISVLTYMRSEEVLAWSEIETDGNFENIAVIPDSGEYQIWVVVARIINGSTVRYVEYFKPFDYGTDQEDAFFVDCGLSYDGAAATTMSGLDHLEGETVDIMADGALHPDETVSLGAITLDYSASKVHAGLHYDSTLRTLNPDIQSERSGGTIQLQKKSFIKMLLKIYRTIGGQFGVSTDELEPINYMDFSYLLDSALGVYTGDMEVSPRVPFGTTAQVYIRQSDPLPFNLLSIVSKLSVTEW